jgi:RNA recognition motif-containing protein
LFIHKQLQGDTVQISSPVLITSDQVISLMLSVHASSTSGLLNTPLDTPRVRRSSIGTTRTSEFSINLRNIESGSDTRTTLMIRSIPRSFTQRKLLDLLESRFAGTFDFVYLPMELTTGLNIGYMFVNMKEPAHIIPLYNSMNNRTWPTILQAVFKSSIEVSEHESLARSCKVTYGRIQGLSALINHFKSSSIMNQPDSIRPHFRKSEELSD